MTERKAVQHRSVSQLNQYSRCAYAYKLSRIDKVWQRPAAWLAQGTAFHSVVDQSAKSEGSMSLEEAQDAFTDEYAKDVGKLCETTPNFQFWARSGPYAGKQDIERRFGIGLDQIEKWYRWRDKHPEEKMWTTPAGDLGSEIGFDIVLGVDPSCPVHAHGIKDDDCDCGQKPVTVKGFIDAVYLEEVSPGMWELRVRDYKTGSAPSDDIQLGVYKVALKLMFDVDVEMGDYWLGKSGKATIPYDLSEHTVESVTETFIELDQNIRAELFEPDPEPSKCRFCDVSNSCSFSMG